MFPFPVLLYLQGHSCARTNKSKLKYQVTSAYWLRASRQSISDAARAPTRWTLQASNNKLTWATLDHTHSAKVSSSDGTSPSTAASCQAWYENGARNSGLYMVDGYGKSSPFQVYCDMENDGGGWTLVSNFRQTSHNCQSGAVGTLTSPSQTSHGRLSDVQIQNLQGEGSGHFRYTRGSDNLKNFYRYRAGYGNRLFYSQKSHARGGMVSGNIHEVAS